MNELLPTRYAEAVHRLALGLVPIDAARALRVVHPVDIRVEGTAARRARHPIARHASCLHVLLYRAGLGTEVDIRISDAARRFVPRRMRVPLPDYEADPNPPLGSRTRRPALFPGAAYDAPESVTGLRGRVARGGAPLRWARIEAVHTASAAVVGRAFGDDRGEFLLLLAPEAMQVGDLVTPLSLDVTAFGPAAPPVAPVPLTDELWDVPLELLPAVPPDTVASGATLPADYTAAVTRTVDFIPGRIISSEVGEFVIP